MHRSRRILTAAFAMMVASCGATPPIALRTLSAPTPTCLQALLFGQLAADPLTGLGLANDGDQTHITWPYGWTTWTDGGRVALVGRHGEVLAHVGDHVTMGGGFVGDRTAVICETEDPPIQVVVPPVPTQST